jgi:hypothetical protein
MHGEPPTNTWRFVEEANDVALMDAAAIVAAAVAQASMEHAS